MDEQSSSPYHDEISEWSNSKSTNVPTRKDSRKFNAVIYGIPECNTGTTRLEKLKQDSCKVFDMQVCSAIVPYNNPRMLFITLCIWESILVILHDLGQNFNSTVYVSNLLNTKKSNILRVSLWTWFTSAGQNHYSLKNDGNSYKRVKID